MWGPKGGGKCSWERGNTVSQSQLPTGHNSSSREKLTGLRLNFCPTYPMRCSSTTTEGGSGKLFCGKNHYGVDSSRYQ